MSGVAAEDCFERPGVFEFWTYLVGISRAFACHLTSMISQRSCERLLDLAARSMDFKDSFTQVSGTQDCTTSSIATSLCISILSDQCLRLVSPNTPLQRSPVSNHPRACCSAPNPRFLVTIKAHNDEQLELMIISNAAMPDYCTSGDEFEAFGPGCPA